MDGNRSKVADQHGIQLASEQLRKGGAEESLRRNTRAATMVEDDERRAAIGAGEERTFEEGTL